MLVNWPLAPHSDACSSAFGSTVHSTPHALKCRGGQRVWELRQPEGVPSGQQPPCGPSAAAEDADKTTQVKAFPH